MLCIRGATLLGCQNSVGKRKRIIRRGMMVKAERGVFESEPPRGQTTIHDVRDALHACSRHTSEGSRSACFVSFGLDSSRVDAYYTIVEDLEECFQKGTKDQVGIVHGLQEALGAMKMPYRF